LAIARNTERTQVYLDKDLKAEWLSLFPDYSSLSWLFETMMRETLALCAKQPTTQENIRQAIQAHATKLATERRDLQLQRAQG
jgi:hypothetical protein